MINIIRAMERSRLDIHACARLLYARTEARGATGTLSMAPNEPIGSIFRVRYDTSNQSRCYEFHRIFRPCRNFVPIPMKPSISFHNFHFCTKPKFHRACPSILVSRSNATVNHRATRRDDCATDERPAYLSTTFTQREKSFEKTRPFGRMRRASERLS